MERYASHPLLTRPRKMQPRTAGQAPPRFRIDFSAESISEASIRESLFLQLPSEIRREIFRYLLPSRVQQFRLYTECESTAAGIKWGRRSMQRRQRHPRMEPRTPTPHVRTITIARRSHVNLHSLAILRTCRLVYYEALSVLYSENLFHFIVPNYLSVLDFIRQRLGGDARQLVRKVRITLPPGYNGFRSEKHDPFFAVMLDILPGLTNLQTDPWTWI